jgi:hypothetical protein
MGNWFIFDVYTSTEWKWNQINNWIWKVNQRGISCMSTEWGIMAWRVKRASEKIYIIEMNVVVVVAVIANYELQNESSINFISSLFFLHLIRFAESEQSMHRRQWECQNLSITWVKIIKIISCSFNSLSLHSSYFHRQYIMRKEWKTIIKK